MGFGLTPPPWQMGALVFLVKARSAETAAVESYTLDEMMNMAMADAYARQAAYAAYAEAFPDDRSIADSNIDTQIVLLEMLLKANGAALPAAADDVSSPETPTEAYKALATAESAAAAMYRSFLSQESLPEDATIIFRSVLQPVRRSAQVFARKTQSAMWAQQWKEIMESGDSKVYEFDDGRGHGRLTVYTYSSDQADEAADSADMADTTDNTVEDSVSD